MTTKMAIRRKQHADHIADEHANKIHGKRADAPLEEPFRAFEESGGNAPDPGFAPCG